MKKDGSWKDFFEDPARFADAINGFGCNGKQVVKEEDIQEVDTQIRRLKIPRFVNSMAGRGVINIISIRDIKDTSVFKTDLRYVLEFLRNVKDKDKLKELVENNPYYQSMDEDAYDVVVNYANVKKLIGKWKSVSSVTRNIRVY